MYKTYIYEILVETSIYSSVHIVILHTSTACMTTIEEVNVCTMIMCFLIWYIYKEKLFLWRDFSAKICF